MNGRLSEHALEFLLAFDGRIHWLEEGYWLKFAVRRGEPSEEWPHGLYYSFTLHDPRGQRIVGFDNAHSVRRRGSRFGQGPQAADHWHRTPGDGGRPYRLTTMETLIDDFFNEVERVLSERGVTATVVAVEERRTKR